jgi:hypothetical protein
LVTALDLNYKKIKELEEQLNKQINKIKLYIPSYCPLALLDLRFIIQENGKDLYRLKISNYIAILYY